MTFHEASDFLMPFGHHVDQSLDQIAETDAGLLYLDWMRGQLDNQRLSPQRLRLKEALGTYLDDSTIKKELRALL